MSIDISCLVSYEKTKNEFDEVMKLAEQKGKVWVIKDNKPAFIIESIGEVISSQEVQKPNLEIKQDNYTLHEAMEIILSEQPDKTMHAKEIADEIFRRGLYFRKNGEKASYNQIRARSNNYRNIFEGLPGNRIKLIKE